MQTLPSYYKAYSYAKDVVNGEILAGKYIIKACNHFLDMTENKESKYYEKYFINLQDNGSGCKEIHYGYGLKLMHERVAILNGTIHFYSEEGFRTVVEIPKIGGKKDD